MKEFDFQSLNQNLLVTINMIENEILNEYKWLSCEGKPDLIQLQYYVEKRARKSLKVLNYTNAFEKLSDLYNLYVHGSLFDENYKEIQVYWNGVLQFGYEIRRDISKGIIYFNDLINYQRFAIKSFVTKILIRIKNFLILLKAKQDLQPKHFLKMLTETNINTIVHRFNELVLPMSIKTLLANTDEIILKTINPELRSLNNFHYETSLKLIKENLVAIDINENNVLHTSATDIVKCIADEITLCTNFLNDLRKSRNALITYDLNLSFIEKETTNVSSGVSTSSELNTDP